MSEQAGGDEKIEAKTDGSKPSSGQDRPTMVKLRGVTKTFERGGEKLQILQGLDLDVPEGSFEALMGPSGSGKSTLLNIVAGLDRPTAGSVVVNGEDIARLSESKLANWRSRTLGFVFQSYNLMPVLNAIENVELPLLLTDLSATERRKRAEIALRVVGLEGRQGHYPSQLSGGQEQRVAIARAIVNDPTLIVADEPTGDLDRQSADDILELLVKLASDLKKTILMVTHDPAAAERATRCHHMSKGVLG
jgi:putative ABC transport system ATP-binding protein